MNKDKLEEREILSAKISREAAEGWRGFCASNGISVSAFLEVAGRELAKETIPPTTLAHERMVITAREVDIERRSRRR